MTDTVARFTNRVENYVKYRPSYPPEILDLFRREMNLQTDSIVADIGAGTGISAKLFLENGNFVIAVEPNAAMREAAAKFLREFPKLKLVDGTSGNTNLENESVDFVVAAQAFHWFIAEKTRAEFQRILKNEGFVALIWNERQLDANDFLRDYERFLHEFATDYAEVRHENVSEEIIKEFFQSNYKKATFENSQTFDFEGLKGRLLSSSYAPTEAHPKFAPMIERLRNLFAQYAENNKIRILYDTNIYYGQI